MTKPNWSVTKWQENVRMCVCVCEMWRTAISLVTLSCRTNCLRLRESAPSSDQPRHSCSGFSSSASLRSIPFALRRSSARTHTHIFTHVHTRTHRRWTGAHRINRNKSRCRRNGLEASALNKSDIRSLDYVLNRFLRNYSRLLTCKLLRIKKIVVLDYLVNL